MMEMTEMARLYALMAPEARYRLFVEAMQRNDVSDPGRTLATHPFTAEGAGDDHAARRKSLFTELSLITEIQRSRIDLLAMVALVVGLACDVDDDGRPGTSESAMSAFRKLMELRQAKREAWLRFCGRIGEDPDKVVAPLVGDIHWAMNMMHTASALLADDAAAEADGANDLMAGELAALGAIWGAGSWTTQ
jgi:hypothetical protein